MSEENKAVVRRFIEEVWNEKNMDAIDQFIAAEQIDHSLPPGLPGGPAGVKAFTGMYMNAFPDINMAIEDQFAVGDKVVTRWRATGTHTGELMGIPATGKQVSITGIDINRIAGGQSVEHWGEFDGIGMMQQLGLAPSPG